MRLHKVRTRRQGTVSTEKKPASRPSYLAVFSFPLVALVALQLPGCVSQQGTEPPPPGGAYLSTSAGANFEQSVNLVNKEGAVVGHIASFALQKLYRVPHNTERLYITLGQSSILLSNDGGKNWQELSTPLKTATGIVDLENGVLVVGGVASDDNSVVIRSLDRGESWETVLTIPTPPEQKRQRIEIIKPPSRGQAGAQITTVVPDPFVPDRLYLGTSLGDVIVGEQSGKIWRTIAIVTTGQTDPITGRRETGIKEIVPSPHRANEAFLITKANGLIRLRDKEVEVVKVVTPSNQAKPILDAAYVQQFPDAVFIGVADGAMVSRDGGVSWEQLNLPLSAPRPYNTVTVVVSPTNPARMLVVANSVVLRSEDGGKSWSTFSLDLQNHIVTDVSINPTNAAYVVLITVPLSI